MVKKAKETSVSEAARRYGTTRKAYDTEGLSGLKDESWAPHHIPPVF